jgi:hypothetical protein
MRQFSHDNSAAPARDRIATPRVRTNMEVQFAGTPGDLKDSLRAVPLIWRLHPPLFPGPKNEDLDKP